MASRGIKDRVAIIGMGCTAFGVRRDRDVSGLLLDAAFESTRSAGIEIADIDAFWLGTFGSGWAGTTLSKALKLQYKAVSRNENFCATGSDSFRNACFAVASGAHDVAMAIGVEKMSDSGVAGLPFSPLPSDGSDLEVTPPGAFSYLFNGYARRFGVGAQELKSALTHVAWKNHANGSANPRAQFRTEVDKGVVACAPDLAGSLSLFDCGGIGDGAAAAIIVRAEDAHRYTDNPVYVKAMSLAVGPGGGMMDPAYDFSTFPEVVASAAVAYEQAGITNPRSQLKLAEVHDCFTITEILLMEDLELAERGTAWKEVLAGAFDRDGETPVNPDGGLKAFGHPLGASGIRMIFECWLQLRQEAGERQIHNDRTLALTQNLGGNPGECLSFVSVLGSELG